MKTAIYPGSFDPVTLGHFDIIKRASGLFDCLIIGVLRNSSKSYLFSEEERVNMLRSVTGDMANVQVCAFDGLLVDFCQEMHADVVIRGLRSAGDMEYELPMAAVNRKLSEKVETIWLSASPGYAAVSSSAVREILSYGRSAEGFVPEKLVPFVDGKGAGNAAGKEKLTLISG
ncbi:MAG: pantetheine-phosphate adenylyltransferase [Lachnospiraceae bacterium]|nr:pantetheine-phosphate adenylyltransferase [Lachnospiraceae bacterium]